MTSSPIQTVPGVAAEERMRSGSAYGLNFLGLATRSMGEPLEGSPLVVVTQRQPDGSVDARRLDGDGVVLDLGGDDRLVMRRERATAEFLVRTEIGGDELVHPQLGPVGSVFNWWQGRASFHAGAFVLDGGAWVVMGERQSGKSTTLAWLHRMGMEVVADDLVVVDEGGRVLPGPRTLDIRPEAASWLADPGLLPVRADQRFRLELPPMAASHPVAGWIVVEEGNDESIELLPGAERLLALTAQLSVRRPPAQPGQLIELASLPTWRWRRPLQLGALAESVEGLLATLGR